MAFSAVLDHKKFVRALEESNLTQEVVAERLGISDRHLRNMCKRDIAVSSALLYNISRLFQRTMEYFLVVEEDTATV